MTTIQVNIHYNIIVVEHDFAHRRLHDNSRGQQPSKIACKIYKSQDFEIFEDIEIER